MAFYLLKKNSKHVYIQMKKNSKHMYIQMKTSDSEYKEFACKYCTYCGKKGSVFVMTEHNVILFICEKCRKKHKHDQII